MKSVLATSLLFCATVLFTMAQNKQVIPLWPNGPKESNGITEPEKIENQHRIINISEAAMTVQLADPSKATGAAVIICPGGGYIGEAAFHEGFQFADWLNDKGVAGIVLKYRLPNGHSSIPLADAQRAVRLVRSYASQWHLDPAKIAIAGFSAGGHLAATLGTHFDEGNATASDPVEHYSSRPNLMLLFYPVVSMKKEITHGGSRHNLLGENPSADLEVFYSNELQVTKDTPPALLLLSDDDKTVLPANSILFYNALKAAGIPASLHVFPSGGHGWGMRTNVDFCQIWRDIMVEWLKTNKFM